MSVGVFFFFALKSHFIVSLFSCFVSCVSNYETHTTTFTFMLRIL